MGNYFNSTDKDTDGRNLVLSDNVNHTKFYDSTGESWDKDGVSGQSWATEIFSPNDIFDEDIINSSRWVESGVPNTLSQNSSVLSAEVVRGEGQSYVTSENKWKLTGDFEITLYIDWKSYYNEYRGITHTFFSVKYDDSNAIRVSFSFDGVSQYYFVSETTDEKDIRYFDWSANGARLSILEINTATQYSHFKITRQSGVLRTYVSDGVVDTQVGNDVTTALLGNEVSVSFGIQNKEYNTYRHAFSKFFVASGEVSGGLEFFSSTRGRTTSFPDKILAVVENQSLSLIDEVTSKLWMRFILGDISSLIDDSLKVDFCNGVLWCATSVGAIAYDFSLDKIFKYVDNEIQVADEPISLRNANLTFRTHMAATGTLPSNDISSISCKQVGSEVYVAMTHSAGVSVKRQLAEGISNSADGVSPGTGVSISDKGSLFWSGYDSDLGKGELSYLTNITSLAVTGTSSFARSGFYDTQTPLTILGEIISSFDIRVVNNKHNLAISTSEGITYIAEADNYSTTYGVQSAENNPFQDPTFSTYIGDSWIPFYTGLIRNANVLRSDVWKTQGDHSLSLSFSDLPVLSFIIPGVVLGVYQFVDMTDVQYIYFDINMESSGNYVWEFQVVVGGQVVKSYANTDGPFIKLSDTALVSGFIGTQKVEFKLHVPNKVESPTALVGDTVMLDNIKVTVGSPVHRVLPPSEAAVTEVLLQHDENEHKIYFASPNGFGAIDIPTNSLDYFRSIDSLPNGEEVTVTSAEFVRKQDEL